MVEPLSGKRSTKQRSPPRRRRLQLLLERLRVSSLNVELSLLQWHCIYFFFLYFPASLLVWGSGSGAARIDYLDSLFLAITSGTGAGLNNVVLSKLNTFQQVVCFLLIFFGAPVFVAAVMVNVRRLSYKSLLDAVVTRRSESQIDLPKPKADVEKGLQLQVLEHDECVSSRPVVAPAIPMNPVITFAPDNRDLILPVHDENAFSAGSTAIGSVCGGTSPEGSRKNSMEGRHLPARKYPTSVLNIGLQEATYSALCILSWIIPIYMLSFQLLGSIAVGAWITKHRPTLTTGNGIQPWWWAFFNSVSAFNNSGMSLLDANMVPFQRNGKFVLLTQSFLILAGNSCFPVFLRMITYTSSKVVKKGSFIHRGLALLADDKKGRLVYPYIFSSIEIWWLTSTIIILNAVDWAAFEITASSSPEVSALSEGDRLTTGLFQAFSVRSGGFAAVSIRELHIGVQFLYVAMMYITVYPLVLNPYYEAELPGQRSPSRSSTLKLLLKPYMIPQTTYTFLRHQFRGLLRAGDLSWLAFCAWLIAILESAKIAKDPSGFSVFAIFFEVASAYGCVGASLGDPSGAPLAFCGAWRGGSKMVLAVVMLGGRLREVRRGVLVGNWGVGGRGIDEDVE